MLADIIDTGKKQKNSLTTVAEEIEYTRKFVELERLWYGDGILCYNDIAPTAEGMLIPGISLQMLVENSIGHGFQTKGGCVRVGFSSPITRNVELVWRKKERITKEDILSGMEFAESFIDNRIILKKGLTYAEFQIF